MAKQVKYLDYEGLKALYGVVDGKITSAVSGAKTELLGDAAEDYNTLGKLEDKIQAEVKRATDAETGLNSRLGALESGDNSVGKQIEALENKLVGDAVTLKTFGAVEDKIDIINGEGQGSMKQAAADAVAKVVANAPEDFDTLKEVAEWIKSDTTGAAKMQSDIANLKGGDTTKGSVAHSIKTAIENLDATVGEAAVAGGKHVAVQVVEADGVVTAVNVSEDNIASADALTTEINRAKAAEDKIEVSVGLAADGSFTAPAGKNYINGATTVMGAVEKLDAQVKVNAVAIDGAINEDAQSITLGTKGLQFVAFTEKEIRDAANSAAGN